MLFPCEQKWNENTLVSSKILTCFIDTNIFLRYFIPEDAASHKECKQFLKQVAEGEIRAFTNMLVVSEIYFVAKTKYKLSKSKCLHMLRGIRAYKGLSLLDSYNYMQALSTFEQYPIKFVDSFIASFQPIADGDMAVISYDKDFDKIPGVIRKTPTARQTQEM